MKAAVMEAYGEPLVVQDIADPEAADGGVVIRVEANGICRSDWHAWIGHWPKPLPHVLGHEMAGVVDSVGAGVVNWKPGDRVIVPFSGGCGTCPTCRTGHTNICDNEYMPGFSGYGGFAQLVALPNADLNLVALPAAMSFVAAAALGCRFMTSFRGVIDQGQVSAGQWVAVHGCGGIGLSAVMIAAAAGANVVAIDIDDKKLDMARQVGAAATVNAAEHDKPVKAVKAAAGGGVDVSIDALGIIETCQNSIKSLKKRGRHVQIGIPAGDQREVPLLMERIVAMELVLIGSHGMPAHDYGAMLQMVASGRLAPEKLVTGTVPLEGASDVLAAMSDYAVTGVTVIDRF